MNSKTLSFTFLLLAVFLPQLLIAQLHIRGQVFADEAPLPFAEILLQDSLGQFVKGNFTDIDGYIDLVARPGNYQIKVSYLGYAPFEKNIELRTDLMLGNLILSTADTQLETVTVTAQRRLIEQRTDRLIFNVEHSVAAAGGNALDALQYAPGVRLQNGLLELIGRGNPAVLLNGRILQLSGQELTEFLMGLAADDIASIEVIANPPARYAAAGQGGLLNIVLKRGRANAWKNSSSLSHTQAFYGHTNFSNTFFYNRERFNLSANTSVRKGFQRDYESIEAIFSSGRWQTELYNKSRMDNLTGRLAAEYQLSNSFSIGGQYLGNFGQPDFKGLATTVILNPEGAVDSILYNSLRANRPVNSHTANFHGSWDLDTLGRKLSFDFDLFDYNNELEQDNNIETFLSNGTSAGINLAQLNFSDQFIDNLSAKIDITHPVNDLELSYGIALTQTETLGDQQNYNTRSGSPVFDPSLSNSFSYNENVQAIYFNASGRWGDNWNWQAGLRLENTQTESYSLTLDQRTPNDYLKLFPTLFLSYKPSETNSYTFSYGRRINRPGFRNLNPFRTYANSNSYSEGNPFLQPSFTDRFEFTHALRSRLRTNIFFNRTIDGHGTLFAAEEEGEIQAVLRRNYYTDYYFGLGESYSFDLGKWSSQNQVYFFAGITEILPGFNTESLNGLQLNLNSSNTIVIGKGKLQLNAWYNAPSQANVYKVASTYGLSLGWQQKLGKALDISLLLNDIFDTASLKSLDSEVNGVTTRYGQNYASRHARLTISYRFGNDNIELKERGFGNDGVRSRSR